MAEDSNEYIYAGFWRRYAAITLDAVIVLSIFSLLVSKETRQPQQQHLQEEQRLEPQNSK